MSQPLYSATCEDGKHVIINEAQVATIEPGPDGTAIVKMANGDVWITVDPDYNNWQADCFVRKF